METDIQIYSISELLQICNCSFNKEGTLYPFYNKYKCSIMFDYTSYISFSDTNYKRNLICSSHYVDIYLICWKKEQRSKIHDHPDKGCVMYILDGKLMENIYHLNKNEPSYYCSRILPAGDSSYNFGSDVLHQIIALFDTISLHIYHKGYIPKCYEES